LTQPVHREEEEAQEAPPPLSLAISLVISLISVVFIVTGTPPTEVVAQEEAASIISEAACISISINCFQIENLQFKLTQQSSFRLNSPAKSEKSEKSDKSETESQANWELESAYVALMKDPGNRAAMAYGMALADPRKARNAGASSKKPVDPPRPKKDYGSSNHAPSNSWKARVNEGKQWNFNTRRYEYKTQQRHAKALEDGEYENPWE
jgi:hypothetical protein